MNYIKNVFLIFYNFIRLSLISILNRNRIRFRTRTYISPFTEVKLGKGYLETGNYFSVYKHGTLSTKGGGSIIVGNNTAIGKNANIVSHTHISIGSNVAIGPNVCIYDHDHVWDEKGIVKNAYKSKEIKIEDNCWIGANVTILAGSIIGEGSIIAAGSIIRGEIPEHSVVYDYRDKKIIPIKK